jgi:arginine/lysine/ornithine decarboxylase
LDPAAVTGALRGHPSARQVIVTNPTYSGTGSRLAEIATVTHAAGATLYVDAAWAPHGRWVPDGGLDPMAAGADACVISLHKTGSALSGAAVLLTAAGLPDDLRERVATDVEGLRSTSPLLPVLVSADLARAELATAGSDGLARAAALAADLRSRCAAVPGVRVLDPGRPTGAGSGPADPLKLVLDVSASGHTGFALQRLLRAAGVIVEGADLHRLYLVLPATVGVTGHGVPHAALSRALRQATRTAPSRPRELRLSPGVWAASRGRQVMLPSQAGARPRCRVPIDAAAGRVAAEHAAPYPPGVPVWVPGEEITAEAVAIVAAVRAAGGEIHGPADPSGRTVAVVAP